MNSEVYERKVDTPDELLARILNVIASIKIVKINSDELQSALRLTVKKQSHYRPGVAQSVPGS